MRKKKNRITRNLTQRIKLHVHALNKVEVWFSLCLLERARRLEAQR